MIDSPRRGEFIAGVRAQLPLLLGVAPFGMAYGAYAVETGLAAGLAQAMSVIVFGGASQFVAVQLIGSGVPAAIVVLAASLVNLRHMLYSASLAPYVDHLAARWRWLLAYVLTDEAYATAIRRYHEDGDGSRRHWFFLGTGIALWATWQATTAAGVLVGTAVPDSWSLDFALPLTFLALLLPALKGRAAIVAAVVAGTIAVAGHRWPYATGLIAAAVAGMAAAVVVARAAGEDAPGEAA